MKKYNIAIIGTGKILNTHIQALNKIPQAHIMGIYGRDIKRTEEIAKDLRIAAFKDYNEILSNKDITVVDIINSSNLHAQYGLEAAGHGKDIICEKPLDASLEKGSKLVSLCQQQGISLGIVYQRRFDEHICLFKRLMKENILGRIISGNIIWRQKRDLDYYLKAKDKFKGVLINNGIHYIDLVIYLMGKEPETYSGIIKKTRKEINTEDYAHIIMEFKETGIFNIDLCTNTSKSRPTIIEINGEKGSIIIAGDKIIATSLDISLGKAMRKKDLFKLYLAQRYKVKRRFYMGT